MTSPKQAQRRPRSVYGVGDDPDPRFSLANERTALAWLRTALAIVAGGVALSSLAGIPELPDWSAALGLVICMAGAGLGVSALIGWRRSERALRLGLPLPAPNALVPLGVAIVILAIAAVVLSAAELRSGV
ncbi:YidH family protein [Demetria terragena]|uniref:YidH family protein n=1 Tax=Demetria terragena TaxID=63959 RepID=UPI000684DB23|nr:DUF202 domain-containing protein [Demetria terragena]